MRFLLGALCAFVFAQPALADPPYSGTAFISPNIITAQDPTSYQGMTPAGRGMRTIFDRRINDWITIEAYLFDATFDDGQTAEFIVNPEFGSETAALAEAQKLGPAIGRLGTSIRRDMDAVWINGGNQAFGGGNRSILAHSERVDERILDGYLDEVLMHEAAHTSLDGDHGDAPGWRAAQTADPEFISTYARDNPDREDVAETLGPWFALRHRPDRLTADDRSKIEAAVPNRLAYFDGLGLDLYPLVSNPTDVEDVVLPGGLRLGAPFPNPFATSTRIPFESASASPTRVEVFDLLGRRVAHLGQVQGSAGPQVVTWSGRDHAGYAVRPGVYVVRVAQDGSSVSRVLVRGR